MAQMPGERPRGGSNSTGGQQAQLQRQFASPAAAAFSPFASRLDGLRQTPASVSQTVTLSGQRYKQFDNGRANVLVPILDPTALAKLAEQRQAGQVVGRLVNNQLGGTLYGMAAMAGASPRVREAARTAGEFGDAILGTGVPRISSVRRPAPAKQGQLATPGWQRPNIRPSELNADRQAGRVEATAIASMLGTGTKANWRIRPPGFEGRDAGHGRGHLYPKDLGGDGNDRRILVTLSQNPTNHPHMSGFDKRVAQQVRSGEVVEYSATPLYTPGVGPPGTILMTATGSKGTRMGRIVLNPAGRRPK